MNNDNQNFKRITILAGSIIILLVLFIVFQLISLEKFHVVSTDPTTNQVSNAVPFFKVNFNKSLLASALTITSSPSITKDYSISGKTLNITLAPLTVNQAYTISIKSITDTSQKTLSNLVFRFTAKSIYPTDLPKDQQQAILKNQDNYSSPANDPIFKNLPHQTLSYTLTGQISSSQLLLNAQLFVSQAEMGDESAAVAQDKQEVVSYIQSLGLNPSNYTIVYTVTAP